jgi:uncharacterized protein YggE
VKNHLKFLLGFALLVTACTAMMSQEKTSSAVSEENVIYVPNVMATITIPADTFTISVSVESANDNGTMASTENNAAMDKAINAMIAAGIRKSDVLPGMDTGISQSQSSNIICDKVGNDTICKSDKSSKNVLTSTKYVVINTTDYSFVTKVLEAARSSGVVVSVLNYGLRDKSSAVDKARQMALSNAESIARAEASQKGKNLGDITNTANRGEYITPSVQAGMVSVTSSVDVSYALV